MMSVFYCSDKLLLSTPQQVLRPTAVPQTVTQGQTAALTNTVHQIKQHAQQFFSKTEKTNCNQAALFSGLFLQTVHLSLYNVKINVK